jgi:hypothetical protein
MPMTESVLPPVRLKELKVCAAGTHPIELDVFLKTDVLINIDMHRYR